MENITTGSGLDLMVATNMSWVRKNSVVWSSIEPNEGAPSTYNWNVMASMETEIKNAYNKGFQIVLVVRSTPQWARKIAGTGPSCGPIAQNKLAAFGTFMNALVARYSVAPYNVKYWEIWNEEDAPYIEGDNLFGCWGDTNDAYYGGGYYGEMLKVVYPQMKAASAQAQVMVGGLVLDCDPRPGAGCSIVSHDPRQSLFLEGILSNGGGPYFDGVSFHSYDYYLGVLGEYYNPNWVSYWNTTGPVLSAKAQYIKSLLGTYGVTGKFLMNTEVATICGSTGLEGPCVTNDASTTKAYYVPQAYAAAIAQNLRASLWYSVLGWRSSQLLNSDLSTTLAYTAFKFGQNELRNTAYAGEIGPSDIGGVTGVKGYKFLRSGRRVWVIWSLDGNPHSVSFSAGAPVAAWDALGTTVTPAASMNITIKPMYLEWNP